MFNSRKFNLIETLFRKKYGQHGYSQWGVGRKPVPLGTNWPKVSTWDMFNLLEELINYRIRSELPTELSKKSKMKEYNH